PAIKITNDNIVVDGRHRIEAHELNNLADIRCEVIEAGDETALIVMAYKENVGGSLPPTPDDTEHTVMLLLEHGEAMKDIATLLRLPPGMARKYVTQVK